VRRMQSNALRTVLAAAVPVGLVLSAAVVWQSTSAAFTATASSGGNEWQAGTVAFSNTPVSTLFSAGTPSAPGPDGLLKPLVPRFRCIQLDYVGNLDADIRLFVTSPDASATSLDQYLEMKVEQGANVASAGPVDPNCSDFPSTATVIFPTASDGVGATGTLEQLKAKRSDWTSGIPVGIPVGIPAHNSVAPNTHLTFRITYLVKDDNGAQGKKSTATFTWEAHNN
jgi:hypothetical protein